MKIPDKIYNVLSKKFIGSFLYCKVFHVRYPFKLIKVPTPYGWMTTFFYGRGLSYMFGRPSEEKVLDYFRLEPGWTVVDAGAHIGWYTLINEQKGRFEGESVSGGT